LPPDYDVYVNFTDEAGNTYQSSTFRVPKNIGCDYVYLDYFNGQSNWYLNELSLCSETDGGKNPDQKSITSGNFETSYGARGDYSDRCDDSNTLIEYYCDAVTAAVRYEQISCKNGCVDGACVADSVEPSVKYYCGDTVMSDYVMTENLMIDANTPGPCPMDGLILDEGVTLDCAGFDIVGSYNRDDKPYVDEYLDLVDYFYNGIYFSGRNSNLINCNIKNFERSIFGRSVNNILISNNNINNFIDGIIFSSAYNINISDNSITNDLFFNLLPRDGQYLGYTGILLDYLVDNSLVSNNKLSNSGISLAGSNNHVTNNELVSGQIYADYHCFNSVIDGNSIFNGSISSFGDLVIISNNDIEKSDFLWGQTPIKQITGFGIYSMGSRTKIYNNNILGPSGINGIRVNGPNNMIYSNYLEGAAFNAGIEGVDILNNTIYNNIINNTHNYWGIVIVDDSMNNTIINNTVYGHKSKHEVPLSESIIIKNTNTILDHKHTYFNEQFVVFYETALISFVGFWSPFPFQKVKSIFVTQLFLLATSAAT